MDFKYNVLWKISGTALDRNASLYPFETTEAETSDCPVPIPRTPISHTHTPHRLSSCRSDQTHPTTFHSTRSRNLTPPIDSSSLSTTHDDDTGKSHLLSAFPRFPTRPTAASFILALHSLARGYLITSLGVGCGYGNSPYLSVSRH